MMCSTDEQQWQESERYGASVLQEARHLRRLPPPLGGSRNNTVRQMQPSTSEVTESTIQPELRERCQGGCLRSVPQAARDPDQQALPEVPRPPLRTEATQ